MKVIYYTATPFLDIAIEIINILKLEVELHVLIEVTPSSANRIGIEKLPENKAIMSPKEILSKGNYIYMEPYFDGCASTNFIIHKSESGFSHSTFKIFYETWKFVKNINPAIIHIEAIHLRSLGLLPFLFSRKRFFFTIHDPVPHSGEANWKVLLPRFLFLRLPYSRSYFFYSRFAKGQFEKKFKKDKNPKYLLRMYPYSIYKKSIKGALLRKQILFFGGLSSYKGINILLRAIPSVFKKFPNESLVIAGRKNDNYCISEDIPVLYKDKIVVLDKYIPNNDLVTLIQESKFVVCPYLDATQSGVLMTAFAINTPVIASNVGAFPEYIVQNISGMLVPVSDSTKLSEAIISALTNNFYETMELNVKKYNDSKLWVNNKEIIINAYFQSLQIR